MRLSLIAALVGLSLVSHAAPQDYLLTTSFEYQFGDKTSKSESTTIIDTDNQKWTTLVPPKNGVSLLGKFISVEGNIIKMEYLVVDSNRGDSVVSSSSIITEVGKQASIETASKNERVLVEAKAVPTKNRSF